ncbi:MAG: carboxypeptidase-like regulatory domain-containing protein, partial [Calditrichaeota bacterium]
MKLKLFSVTCAILLLLAGTVFSAVTGKIVGVITDVDNQQPLVGVTVSVQGTSWGAVTDVDGRYQIQNVPVGTYNLVITTVGYQGIELTGVDVHADLATYQSQALSSKVTELGTTISVVAENPLIIKDKTTTVNIIKSEEIQALPTRGFEQIVGIQNSVVRMNSNVDNAQRGGSARKATGGSINLRGGRP